MSRSLNRASRRGLRFCFPRRGSWASPAVAVTDPRFAAAASGGSSNALDSAVDEPGTSHVGIRRRQHASDVTGHWATPKLVTLSGETFFDAETMVARTRAGGWSRCRYLDPTPAPFASRAWFPPVPRPRRQRIRKTSFRAGAHRNPADPSRAPALCSALRLCGLRGVALLLARFGATGDSRLAILYFSLRVMPVSVFAQNAVTSGGSGHRCRLCACFSPAANRKSRRAAQADVRFPAVAEPHRTPGKSSWSPASAVCTGFRALPRSAFSRPAATLCAIGGVACRRRRPVLDASPTLLPALLLLSGEKVELAAPDSSVALYGKVAEPGADEGAGGDDVTRSRRYLIPSVVVLAVLIVPDTLSPEAHGNMVCAIQSPDTEAHDRLRAAESH